MESQARIELALDSCYQAVYAPSTWPAALHELARSLDAVCCGFYPRGAAETRLRLPASPDYLPFLEEFYRDGWWRSDHRARRGWPMAEAGRKVLLEHDVASEEDRRTLPQYRDLYARHDVPWWGAVFFRNEGRLWAMPFLRSRSQGPFTPEDTEVLTRVARHCERMLSLASKLGAATVQSALQLVDQLACAAMALGPDGRVSCCNRGAERLLGSDMNLKHGRLTVADPAGNAALQRLIAAAVGEGSRALSAQPTPLVIQRSGRRPLLIEAFGIPEMLADPFLRSGTILVFSDLDDRLILDEGRLRKVFGLTPAEARLAALVGGGQSPRNAAGQLGVTEESARTTLKRVFAKIGVSRQSELTAMLSRMTLR
jgi:DNA-binding CsgD family transcriptional regulator